MIKYGTNVYISSTTYDLKDSREAVVSIILRLGLYPISMESFNVTDRNSMQLAYDQIQDAEIWIGIYADRYGYIPSSDMSVVLKDGSIITGDNKTSISEWEYRWAKELNIPILLFVAHDGTSWSPESTEHGNRIKVFKDSLLKQHTVGYFSTPDELVAQVAHSLVAIMASYSTENSTEKTNNDCIENFDERVLNSVMKALEITDIYRATSRSERDVDDPHILNIKPAFSTPLSKLPQYQCNVFVIMPFADQFTAVYTDIIKLVCDDLQLTVKRGDDFFANHYIMEEIWFALNNCDLVIADYTGKNPNVFYELGIAHTLGKPTIPITQDAEVPFDVAGKRFLKYEDSLAGSRKFIDELKSTILLVLNNQDNES